MVQYRLEFHPAAKKELDKLVQSLSLFIETYSPVYELELMHQSKVKKLKGEWKGFYWLRLRNYRVIYEKINEKLVIHIVRVAYRREVY